MDTVETDVLIVGSGPAGASAALALSTYGVPNIVVTRYARLADTPRAHITNQRTMEVLRDLGVEERGRRAGHPAAPDGQHRSSAPASRARSWAGCAPGATTRASRPNTNWPAPPACATCRSTSWSPCCVRRGRGPGHPAALRHRVPRPRRRTPRASPSPCGTGCAATSYTIRARYLIGADGGRSRVAEDAGLPMRRPDGRGRQHQHRLRGGPAAVHRPPPLHPLLGARPRRHRRRHRRRAWCDACGPGTSG